MPTGNVVILGENIDSFHSKCPCFWAYQHIHSPVMQTIVLNVDPLFTQFICSSGANEYTHLYGHT